MSEPYCLDEHIQQMVQKHIKSIARVAYSYVRNIQDAEDIAQDTFIGYLEYQGKFKSEEHEKAWLIRVCINKSKNFLKSGWNKSRNPLPENLEALSLEENYVLEAVLDLDEKYRIPIHLYYYEGYSIKDISRFLSLPSGTVGTRLARGKEQLKKQLGGEFDED